MKAPQVALATSATLLAIWLTLGVIRSRKEQRDLLSWIKISVIQIDNSIPPGLLIEVKNDGPRVVRTSHFRLIFEADEKMLCRVDVDHGNFAPGENRKIVLKAAEFNNGAPRSPGTNVRYFLQVFPEYKKGLAPIVGTFFLR